MCPECGGNTFYTTAHIMQEWLVDDEGDFVEEATNCLEVTHEPSPDNSWICVKCGNEGVPVKKSWFRQIIAPQMIGIKGALPIKEEYSKWLRIHSAQMRVSERVLEIMLKREEDRREFEES